MNRAWRCLLSFAGLLPKKNWYHFCIVPSPAFKRKVPVLDPKMLSGGGKMSLQGESVFPKPVKKPVF